MFFGFFGLSFVNSVPFSRLVMSKTLWPMNRSTPGLPVHHQLPESTQTHVHWGSDAIQPSHPLLSPSSSAINLSQHQGLFEWISSSDLEVPILWPSDAKGQLIQKDPDAGKDWRQEEKGMTEDEMVGWYHWLNRHEFEQALGDGEGQGSLLLLLLSRFSCVWLCATP